MELRKLWKVAALLIFLGIVAVLMTLSACTSTPATVTSTITSTPAPITVTVTATPPAITAQLNQLKQIAGPPPSSLDNFFPPKVPAPVYLIEMFGLAGPMEGIGTNLQENDIPNMKAGFQPFKAQYTKMSTMVPEWTSLFPMDPVNALGTAIDSGNPALIGPALGKIGEVCNTCHLLYIIKVQQKYHWKNFDDIKTTNPVTKQSQGFGDYMTTMAGGFSGATVDLQQGKLDAARKNWQDFVTQYKTLATEGCKQCHSDPVTNKEIPRKYFVDADSMALIDQMSQALAATTPDDKAIGDLSGAIGNGICVGCHWIHMPAQNTKDLWSTYSNILK